MRSRFLRSHEDGWRTQNPPPQIPTPVLFIRHPPCADETSILDEFPPHEWHGAGACATWLNDFDADAKKNGVTDGVVTLGKPSHVDVSSDYAYVVIPADYRFKQKGKPASEIGSIITLSLKRSATGWRITGWAWAKH